MWTILTIPFTVAAFRVHKLFGALFFFVFFAFLGGALANLVGLNTAYGGWSALISSAIGVVLLTQSLMKATIPQEVANDAEVLSASSVRPSVD